MKQMEYDMIYMHLYIYLQLNGKWGGHGRSRFITYVHNTELYGIFFLAENTKKIIANVVLLS